MRTLVILFAGGILASAQFPRPPRKARTGSEQTDDNRKVSATGVIRKMDEKSITLEATDSRLIEIKVSASTKFRKGDGEIAGSLVNTGDSIRVDAVEDSEGYWTATTVVVTKSEAPVAGGPSPSILRSREAPERPVEPATTRAAADRSSSGDDEGPPKLRRGIPKARPKPRDDEDAPIAGRNEGDVTPVAAPADPKQQLIDRAREAAFSFSEGLPNYVAQQFTTRYVREGDHWRALDVVSATVVYENGKESYRDLQINGKPVKKNMEEMSGSWSTGEFGTTLKSLFDPRSAAQFDFRKQSTFQNFNAMVFDYAVDRQHSDWRITVASQAVIPAFLGRVWIDAKTARALRIEMSAVEIPLEFPMDKVEAAQDYGQVRLGPDEYLLPIHAENLSCQRGSPVCSRNVIEFRNYHKYQGETKIVFDK